MDILVQDDDIQIKRLSLGPYGTNTYILVCVKTKNSVIVDAPGDPEQVYSALAGAAPRYILITHNHMDHTGALARLKSDLDIPVAAHASDVTELPVKPDLLLQHDDTVSFGNITLTVLHTPGHTLGSLCFRYGKYLISGDTIFPGGPGKTWSSAAFMQIKASLSEKIFTLPGDTLVFPGHGDGTNVGKEKEAFLTFSAKSHEPDLCGDVVWLS